jgi:hypothetical protein
VSDEVRSVEFGGFTFEVSELDGCKLIESHYPREVELSNLSSVISRYYDLWDDDKPTASLVDLTLLARLDDDLRRVLKSVIQRTILVPTFVGSAWYTGDNDEVRRMVLDVRREAGRTAEEVFRERSDALAYLRTQIAAWQR